MFYVNVPIGAAAFAFGAVFLRQPPQAGAGRFDLIGFLLSGFGLEIPRAFTAAPGALPGVTTYFNAPALAIMLVLTAML